MKNDLIFRSLLRSLLPGVFCVATIAFCGCSSSDNAENDSVYADAVKDMDLPTEVKEDYVNSSELMDDAKLALKKYNLTHSDEEFETLFGFTSVS